MPPVILSRSRFEKQPPELLICLVPYLNLEDYMSLRCTSRRLRRIMRDDGILETIGRVRCSL